MTQPATTRQKVQRLLRAAEHAERNCRLLREFHNGQVDACQTVLESHPEYTTATEQVLLKAQKQMHHFQMTRQFHLGFAKACQAGLDIIDGKFMRHLTAESPDSGRKPPPG